MTIESAIKHCEEVAEKLEKQVKPYQCEFVNKKLYEVNKKEWSSCLKCAEEHRQLARWLRELKQLKEQMSNSEKPNKWISTSEDMPIIGQNVLVCDIDGDIYITSLHLDGGWGFDEIGNKIKNVVAWMELPEPYRVESEDKE